jgi:hypothetical protein
MMMVALRTAVSHCIHLSGRVSIPYQERYLIYCKVTIIVCEVIIEFCTSANVAYVATIILSNDRFYDRIMAQQRCNHEFNTQLTHTIVHSDCRSNCVIRNVRDGHVKILGDDYTFVVPLSYHEWEYIADGCTV